MLEKNENKETNEVLKEMYDMVKISWNDFVVCGHDYFGDPGICSEIDPMKYLEFAKLGRMDTTEVGLINSLTNAKRAIDAQIDIIISFLGYDYKKFNNKNTKNYIKQNFDNVKSDGITEKIKLLNILGLAPTLLLSKIRKLRNYVEHEYKTPDEFQVKEAIEVAELFINASNRKINITNSSILFGSRYYAYRSGNYDYLGLNPSYIFLEFLEEKYFNIVCVNNNKDKDGAICIPYSGDSDGNYSYKIFCEDKLYTLLLEVIFNYRYSLLPHIFGFNLEERFVKYKRSDY